MVIFSEITRQDFDKKAINISIKKGTIYNFLTKNVKRFMSKKDYY